MNSVSVMPFDLVSTTAPPGTRRGTESRDDDSSFSSYLEKAKKDDRPEDAELAAAAYMAPQRQESPSQPEADRRSKAADGGQTEATGSVTEKSSGPGAAPVETKAAANGQAEGQAQGRAEGQTQTAEGSQIAGEIRMAAAAQFATELEAQTQQQPASPPVAGPEPASPQVEGLEPDSLPVEVAPTPVSDEAGEQTLQPTKPLDKDSAGSRQGEIMVKSGKEKTMTEVKGVALQQPSQAGLQDDAVPSAVKRPGAEPIVDRLGAMETTNSASTSSSASNVIGVENAHGFGTGVVNSFESARLTEARDTQPLVGQILRGFESATKSGQTSVHLQLYPENLGKVDLRVSTGADGLNLTLSANQASTGALLEQYLPELKQALADAGVSLGRLSIGFGQSQGNSFDSGQWGSRHGSSYNLSGGFMGTEPESEQAVAAYRVNNGSSVEYRI